MYFLENAWHAMHDPMSVAIGKMQRNSWDQDVDDLIDCDADTYRHYTIHQRQIDEIEHIDRDTEDAQRRRETAHFVESVHCLIL